MNINIIFLYFWQAGCYCRWGCKDTKPVDSIILIEKDEMKKRSWSLHKKWDYHPTGKLSLRYESWAWGSEGLRKTWADGKTKDLEEMVVDFVIGGIKITDAMRHHRIIREQEEGRRQEEMRIRAESERKRQQELERRNILEKQAEQWKKSRQLREYIDAVESSFGKQDQEQDARLNNWLTWARQNADRIDPLQNDPPSIYEHDVPGSVPNPALTPHSTQAKYHETS